MRKRMRIIRAVAILLAMILFLNNEQMVYVLATATENIGGENQMPQEAPSDETLTEEGDQDGENSGETVPDVNEGEGGDETPKEEACDHDWVTNDEGTEAVCSKCGETKAVEPENPEEECEHEWITDPETSLTICSKCGKEKAEEEECEHEWVTDPETSLTICSKCGKEKAEEECEHEWVTDPETSLTICSKCGKEKAEEEECEHEWMRDPETLLIICSKCGKEKTAEDICEHEWMRDPETLLIVCSKCYEESLEEEEECPEGGFHIYDLNEEGTGWVCVLCGVYKETLDVLDVTLEMYLKAMGDVSLLGLDDADDPASSKLPKTKAELDGYLSKDLTIASLGDLLVIQELSKETDFKGYNLIFSNRSLGKLSANYSVDTWELSTVADFKGIGDAAHPFSGTVYAGITGVNLQLSVPLFQYASTDASINTMNIKSDIHVNDSATPVGIIAGTLVKGDAPAFTFGRGVNLEGTVSNASGAAGMLFGRVENQGGTDLMEINLDGSKITYTKDSSVSGLHAGGVIGEIQGEVKLNISSPKLVSRVSVKSVNSTLSLGNALSWSASAAGMYVGAMEDGEIAISGGSESYMAQVGRESGNGGVNGGLVGLVLGAKVTTDGSQISIAGPGVTGQVAGGVFGYYQHEDGVSMSLEHLLIDVPVDASGAQYAGGVLGRYYRDEDGSPAKDYDIISDVTVQKNVQANQFAAGIAGSVQGSNLKIQDVSITGNITNVSGGAEDNRRGVGGVIGRLEGQYVEIERASVKTTFNKEAFVAGGIVGEVVKGGDRNAILKITDPAVDSAFGDNNAYYRGGILGYVGSGNFVALDGSVQVGMACTQNYGKVGHIAGSQRESLIYLETDAEYTRPTGKNWQDDIGNYGGVYRNGTWGEGAPLISYADGKVMGTVGNSGGTWQIDSEADLIRLAIMLNTEGNYAAECFGGTGKGGLLTGSYQVTRSLDISKSGIYDLNRNDSIGKEAEMFKGSFRGPGSGTTIDLGEVSTNQKYLGLFPYAGRGAEISGFTLERTINYAEDYAGGLASDIRGNFTTRDVTLLLNMQSYISGSANNRTHFYGGVAGRIVQEGGEELTVENLRVGGNWQMKVANGANSGPAMGGLTAFYNQVDNGSCSRILVDGFELMESFKLTSGGYRSSGMFTWLNNTYVKKDRTRLSMQNIKIHNGAVMALDQNSDDPGSGWLGMSWNDVTPDDTVHYSIKGLQIGDGGSAAQGPAYSSRAVFGGLVDSVTGRIQLQNISIQNGTFNNVNRKDRIGLLFRLGHNALIEIDGYDIAGRKLGDMSGANNTGAVQLVNFTAGNYDEIVSYNIGIHRNNSDDYQRGGIVNIIYDGFTTGHKVYQNRLLDDKANTVTRYYYNLFGNSFAAEDSFLSEGEKLTKNAAVITNERQMMIWHLTHYMNDDIRRYLAPYYVDGQISDRSKDTVFKGCIDLKGVSYYPTWISGGAYLFNKGDDGRGAEIKFHAQEISDAAGTKMTPENNSREHYMMHGGLFISRSGNVTVKGDEDYLTLSGTVAHLSQQHSSGALFVMYVTGNKGMYRIRLKDLYLTNYKGEDSEGLLIGRVNEDSSLDLSWIETEYTTTGKKAAAALIGVVGNEQAKNISIEFKNMKLDSRRTEGIFQNASLIDSNYYLEDKTNQNWNRLRRLRYLFTERAFDPGVSADNDPYPPFDSATDTDNANYGNNEYTESYVTIGAELKDGVEFWDNENGPVDGTSYDFAFWKGYKWDYSKIETDYVPYVHTIEHVGSKEIEVNPKNRPITEGCGTYEDPYQITSAKQLLALGRYLQNKDDTKYLEGWQVNKYESGRSGAGSICNKTCHDDGSDLRTYRIDSDFPTQAQLSQAYYMIMNDIKLDGMTNATDKQIAEDFLGLGTLDMPFRGVIVGKQQDDGSYPTISLPVRRNYTGNTADANHGFIQYAKGAVVKDLHIKGGDAGGDDTRTGIVKVRSMAGGVMACILGGDNIIDNVTVELEVGKHNADTVQAGAYVGNIRQGSLILRNLKEDSAKGFRVGSFVTDNGKNGRLEAGSTDADRQNLYISGLVGKVENGCVIYDDAGASYSGKVLPHDAANISGIYTNDEGYPVCKHYDIIVKSHLDSDGKIDLTSAESGGVTHFTAKVSNASQLQVVSMAVNSDAFSVCYMDGGYDKTAVCRKAAYSDVGNVPAATADFTNATTEDDKTYDYPYLYKEYIAFHNAGGRAATFVSAGGDQVSRLNGVISHSDPAQRVDLNAVMNYQLSNTTYDMSVYDRGFRGIGATYRIFSEHTSEGIPYEQVGAETFYSDFRANFLGNGAVINLGIDRSYDRSIHTAALFNDLLDRRNTYEYTLSDFTVTGAVSSVVKDSEGNITSGGNEINTTRTAGVVGLMRRPWKIKNVKTENILIEGRGNTGGIVAWIEADPDRSDKTYDFNGCIVGEGTKADSYGGSVGGVIGVICRYTPTGTPLENVKVNLTNCAVKGSAADPDKHVILTVKDRKADKAPGGGDDSWRRRNTAQAAAGRSGGLVGYIGSRFEAHANDHNQIMPVQLTIENGVAEYAQLVGAYSAGGLLGEYDAHQDAENPSSATTSAGVTVTDSRVSLCQIESYRWNLKWGSLVRDDWRNYGAGGLIGGMRGRELVISASQVENTNITASSGSGDETLAATRNGNPGIYAGGAVGCIKARAATITDVTVEGGLDASARADLELGGQQYRIRSWGASAGGLVGMATAVSPNMAVPSALNLSGIKVKGMRIDVDDRKNETVFETTGGAEGNVGGVVGRNQMQLSIKPKTGETAQGAGATVENCMILCSINHAGGVLGAQVKHYNNNNNAACPIRNTSIWNVEVKNSIIGTNNTATFLVDNRNDNWRGIGGIYGALTASQDAGGYNRHYLENAEVSGCWIYGYSTGGVLGLTASHVYLLSNAVGTETADSVKIRNNKMYGMVVGGVIGTSRARWVNYIGTLVEGNVLQGYKNHKDWSPVVGGFFGSGASITNHIDYARIRNNGILAANANAAGNKRIAVGGFAGVTEWSNGANVYCPELTDNLIGYRETTTGDKFAGNVTNLKANETLQTLFGSGGELEVFGSDGKPLSGNQVKLVYGNTDGALKTCNMPSADELRENTAGYYGARIGNLVGINSGNYHSYYLAPKISYSSDIKTRPVIDVGGSFSVRQSSADLLTAPYAYRKFVHIIYHEPLASADADANVWDRTGNTLLDGTTISGSKWKTLFGGISYTGIMEEYRNAKTSTDLKAVLDAYHLNAKTDRAADALLLEEVYQNLYKDENGDLLSTLTVTGDIDPDAEILPLIVLDTQYGTADELVKSVVTALTGTGGAYNDADGVYSTGMAGVTDIKAEPVEIKNGQIQKRSGTASLKASKQNNKWTVDYVGFDNDGLDGNPQTFTLLTVTYFWDTTLYKETGSETLRRSKTIRIPVYVVERLMIDTHLKIIEDLVYNTDKVKQDGMSSNVVIANDSSYTLYSEYIYGAARKKYHTGIEKYVGLSENINGVKTEKGFVAGTKLTLIDICDHNKVYYYVVKEGDTGPYKYSDFVDEAGNNYVNKPIDEDEGFEIHGEGDPPFQTTDTVNKGTADNPNFVEENYTYEKVAVEKFLITVDMAGVKPENLTSGSNREFNISPQLEKESFENLDKKATLTNHTNLQARIFPGMKIEFYGKNAPGEEDRTYIEGNIKADDDGLVNVWATIDISALPLFWTLVKQNGENTIDSANNNKYLELQTYLTEVDSEEPILLPNGTNVTIEGKKTVPVGISVPGVTDEIARKMLDPYYDRSNIHFYKDGKLEFRLNDLVKIIDAEREAKNNHTDGRIRWSNKLTLDFRNADMTEYSQDKYDVHINLLRIENKDYPVGGERLDHYQNTCLAAQKQDLACAVETKDLLQLGINTYEHQTSMPHEVDFDFKLDFTGILTGIKDTDQKTAEKYYTVAYRILEKKNVGSGVPHYEVYQGDQVALALVNDPNGRVLTPAVTADGEKFHYTSYRFTLNEIEKGTKYQTETGMEQNPGVILRNLKLTVKDADKMNLSNYKIQAIVYVSDSELIASQIDLDSITSLTDFFVFSVAKLKTDLDY